MANEELAQRVRLRAYYLWEQEGRPEGRDQEYWLRALEQERAAAVPDSVIADPPSFASVAAEAAKAGRKVPARTQPAEPAAPPAPKAAKPPAAPKKPKAGATKAGSAAKPRPERPAGA